jgi:hypothetical protein
LQGDRHIAVLPKEIVERPQVKDVSLLSLSGGKKTMDL